jgi:hypothetical protein
MISPYKDLCSSVLWALKRFPKIRPVEMAEVLDTERKPVTDELRRLYEFSMLKMYIKKEKTPTATYYSLDPIAKDVPVEFLKDLAKKTWKFGVHYKTRRASK